MTTQHEIREYIKNAGFRINPQALAGIMLVQRADTQRTMDTAITFAKKARRKTVFEKDIFESESDTKTEKGVELIEGG